MAANNGEKTNRVTGTSRWTTNRRRNLLSDEKFAQLLPTITEPIFRPSVPEVVLEDGSSSIDLMDCSEPPSFNTTNTSFSREQMIGETSLTPDTASYTNETLEMFASIPSIVSAGDLKIEMIEPELHEATFVDGVDVPYLSDSENGMDSDPEIEKLQVLAGNELFQGNLVRLLSAAFYLKHHLSKEALGDYLQILNFSNKEIIDDQLSSSYLFLKRFKNFKNQLRRIYPCPVCFKSLKTDEKGEPLEIQACGHKYSQEKLDGCYTLMLPIEEQILFFLKHHGLKEKSTEESEFIGDVTTGGFYIKLRKEGVIGDNTISIQLFVDGAQIFKSSKYSFWPFVGIINEAPYKVRRSCVILLALWFGKYKPPRSVFLDPCVEELNRIAETGIVYEGTKYTVRPVIVTVDTIARPTLRNTTQFNGEFGCDFCLHPGVQVKKGKRCYGEQMDDSKPKYPLRTNIQYQNDLKEAIKSGETFHGIKGPTSLSKIHYLDFIRAFVPEYMHSVCLGVVRYLILLWIGSKKTDPWYIGDRIEILNRRIANTRPPFDISRILRSLDTVGKWKASEFRTFLLYFYPLLEDILPEPFFTHFGQLSYSIFVLLQENVSKKCVEDVGILLQHFVKETEYLYGHQYVTYNMHLLTHLSSSVLDWGCLWSTSAFIPEWFNGQLGSLCNGTQAVIEQMANSFHMQNEVRNEIIDLLKKQPVPENIKKLFKSMLFLPQIPNMFCVQSKMISASCKYVGKPSEKMLLSASQKVSVKSLITLEGSGGDLNLLESINTSLASFYPKLELPHNSVFTTSSYKRSRKRINYFALLKDNSFFLIESFVLLENNLLAENQSAFVLGRTLGVISKFVFAPSLNDGMIFAQLPGQTTRLDGKSAEIKAIRPESILRKCVVASMNSLTETYCLTALANTLESD